MSKRGALTDLNHDNWDQEEPEEERGSFKRASEDELKRRVIKKAVRRTPAGGSGEGQAIFSNFTGFGSVQAKPPSTAFSFLQNAAPAPTGFKIDTKPAATSSGPGFFSGSASAGIKPSSTTDGAASSVDKKTDDSVEEKYSNDLKTLNLDFAKWVQQCVEKNPVCILTPLFDDYKKYLKELEDEKQNKKRTSNSFSFGTGKAATAAKVAEATTTSTTPLKTDRPEEKTPAKTSFTFGSALSSSTTDSVKPPATGFTFGNLSKPTPASSGTVTDPQKPTATGFTFGSGGGSFASLTPANTTSSSTFTIPSFATTQSKPFSFDKAAAPFSFGNVGSSQPASKVEDDKKADGEGGDVADDDEPPKVEFTPVVEEDSVYSKRCKVFIRVDKDYKDRGVGTLYIKNVQDGAKTQVLVRADTSLGNILLNALLTKEIPLKRMGKNNVMLPIMDNDKPTTALIRVKTGEDADELLENMEKNKK